MLKPIADSGPESFVFGISLLFVILPDSCAFISV